VTRRRPSLLILVAVSAVNPLALNILGPSMPGLVGRLGTTEAKVQLTLTLYLAAVALAQIVIGPLSDRYGRRPVMNWGLALFVVATALCALAPTIEILILGRILQAAGGCTGIVLSRAIVRDLYDRDRSASMIGYVTMGLAVAPALGPAIGGALDEAFGWRSIFWFLVAVGVLVLAAALRMLHETQGRDARGGGPTRLVADYAALAGNRQFAAFALTGAFSSAVFFAFLGGAPYVATRVLGMSPSAFGVWFATVAIGYSLGNFASGRQAARRGARRMILSGNILACAGIGLIAVLFGLGLKLPISLFGPMFLIGFANGLALPSAIAGAVSVRPDLAGSAAGLSGSLQLGLGGLATFVVGAIIGASVWPLVAVMAVSIAVALAAGLFVAPSRASPHA